MTPRPWLLGAPDPEMEAIDALLRACGEHVAYATFGGRRVAPADAYRADGTTPPLPADHLTAGIVAVECGGPVIVARETVWGDAIARCDHHRPGDQGFGRPPAEFLAASSIGQVLEILGRLGRLPAAGPAAGLVSSSIDDGRFGPSGFSAAPAWRRQAGHPSGNTTWFYRGVYHVWDRTRKDGYPGAWCAVPHALVLLAAADHCLAAAYRGGCPGVDPHELMRWRVSSRAAFQGRAEEAILRDIAATREALRVAHQIALTPGNPACSACDGAGVVSGLGDFSACDRTTSVADMRRNRPWPELPEAAAREGLGYVSGPLIDRDGRRRFTCAGSEAQVRAWMEHWAPAQGIVDIYGDPVRGFAGGYES